jgi:hypothetical protein
MVKNLHKDARRDIGYLNTTSLGWTRARRNKESQAVGSPALPAGFVGAALVEAVLELLLLGTGNITSPDAMRTAKWQVREWFELERFPEGWLKSTTVLTIANSPYPIVGRATHW